MTDKEIMQQAKEIEALKIELESANSEYKRMSAEAGGKIGELKADAERYRFIRNDCGSLEMGFYENGWDDRLREWLSHDSLDNIIDAAITKQKEPT
jgi:hypothetical protein